LSASTSSTLDPRRRSEDLRSLLQQRGADLPGEMGVPAGFLGECMEDRERDLFLVPGLASNPTKVLRQARLSPLPAGFSGPAGLRGRESARTARERSAGGVRSHINGHDGVAGVGRERADQRI
jgi:hypothetical protein